MVERGSKAGGIFVINLPGASREGDQPGFESGFVSGLGGGSVRV